MRFRLKPGLKNLVGYVYEPGKGVDSLTKTEVRDLPQEFKERNVCRNVHFNLLDYDKEYKSKDVTEGKKPIKFIVTDGQFKDLMKYINENVKFRKIR